jgi:hypothetical protein
MAMRGCAEDLAIFSSLAYVTASSYGLQIIDLTGGN